MGQHPCVHLLYPFLDHHVSHARSYCRAGEDGYDCREGLVSLTLAYLQNHPKACAGEDRGQLCEVRSVRPVVHLEEERTNGWPEEIAVGLVA